MRGGHDEPSKLVAQKTRLCAETAFFLRKRRTGKVKNAAKRDVLNYFSYFCGMETKEQNSTATMEAAESIGSKYRVDYVESGLPRWLIEAAFVCMILQAAIGWSPLLKWTEEHCPWLQAVVMTFGALVMYVALLRGCRRLYRPFTAWWWAVVALNILGFLSLPFPSLDEYFGLPVAVALMLVYLPLGCLIAYCYRGRLRQVGIWMALYILVSSIVPVLWFLLGAPDSDLVYWIMEFSTIGVILVYAWVLRRVLIK